MLRRSLEQLEHAEAIERRRVDAAVRERLLAEAHTALEIADLAAGRGLLDRAVGEAYEAALRASIVLLASAGYRLRKGQGHHLAALEAALAILGPDWEPLLSRVDDARAVRNAGLYGTLDAAPAVESHFERVRDDAARMLAEAERRSRRPASAPPPAPSRPRPRARR
ncbi:MAG TPA: hypothetical protein VFM93_14435 [Candidatus Limnocylindria bacterium]|nr:hypothetical protein [Candidatus Limnocylindria bacterium]